MSKNKPRRRLRISTLVLLCCFVVAAFAYANQFVKLQQLQEKKAYYAAVYEDLQEQNAELLETRALINDETYMERLARQRFKLIKPNEYLVLPAETNEDVEAYAGVDDNNIH
ncbi:MAG TPA: septum formation initiator family protein [Candidatus Avidehalobacter gallistercoris]|uniref:Septum formation initiator family protein n=1 Tax=Candidatus Avidehalobacter gallistercoris TaxID=2840694 RepID=A0A9D1HKM6_9FIRM|nr:septum formation initiator family protein [Candidatus Avidehalobacter gallistercoris]